MTSNQELAYGNSFENHDFHENVQQEGDIATFESNSVVPFGNEVSEQPFICQVEDCGNSLDMLKDYYKRHRVCEMHSKVLSVRIAGNIQRFCQQCSKFHDLDAFDGERRSCRRRLLGHNRRRRKKRDEFALAPGPPLDSPGSVYGNSGDRAEYYSSGALYSATGTTFSVDGRQPGRRKRKSQAQSQQQTPASQQAPGQQKSMYGSYSQPYTPFGPSSASSERGAAGAPGRYDLYGMKNPMAGWGQTPPSGGLYGSSAGFAPSQAFQHLPKSDPSLSDASALGLTFENIQPGRKKKKKPAGGDLAVSSSALALTVKQEPSRTSLAQAYNPSGSQNMSKPKAQTPFPPAQQPPSIPIGTRGDPPVVYPPAPPFTPLAQSKSPTMPLAMQSAGISAAPAVRAVAAAATAALSNGVANEGLALLLLPLVSSAAASPSAESGSDLYLNIFKNILIASQPGASGPDPPPDSKEALVMELLGFLMTSSSPTSASVIKSGGTPLDLAKNLMSALSSAGTVADASGDPGRAEEKIDLFSLSEIPSVSEALSSLWPFLDLSEQRVVLRGIQIPPGHGQSLFHLLFLELQEMQRRKGKALQLMKRVTDTFLYNNGKENGKEEDGANVDAMAVEIADRKFVKEAAENPDLNNVPAFDPAKADPDASDINTDANLDSSPALLQHEGEKEGELVKERVGGEGEETETIQLEKEADEANDGEDSRSQIDLEGEC